MANNPIFPETPPNPSYSTITAAPQPFGTLPYQVESPLYVYKQIENWAQIDQQRFHDEALQWFGEECVVRLLWRAEDAAAGLVGYCQTCQDSVNPTNPNPIVQARVSKAYRQTGNSYCPDCYGTTFTGGFQPIAYHLYMLASDTPEVRVNLSTGQFWKENPQVQFSWYPQLRQGDIVGRVSEWKGNVPTVITTRFQVSAVSPVTVRTGPTNSAQPPYRVGLQPLQPPTNNIIVNQMATLENLWPGHPYYSVPLV